MHHIDWFADVKLSLHCRGKSYLVMAYNLFDVFFNWFANILLRNFASVFVRGVCVCVCVCVCVLNHFSCVQLCDIMDCRPSGFCVHGISHVRILEWISISFSRGSFQLRDQIYIFCITGKFFTTEPPGTPLCCVYMCANLFPDI